MGNLPKVHGGGWAATMNSGLSKQSLAGGSFSVLETSLKVILGSGPTAIPLPKSNCPDQHAQWGGWVSTSLPGGPQTQSLSPHPTILPALMMPTVLPWASLVSVHYYSFSTPRPRAPMDREGMLSLNVSRKDFLFSFILCVFHLQRPAGRT